MRRNIEVVGAAIIQNGKLLALRRKSGIDSVVHKFEFVGGKIESGETPVEALMRECREELSLDIIVVGFLGESRFDYPEFSVRLRIYISVMCSDYLLKEHEEAAWLDCSSLKDDEWAPADAPLLEILRESFSSSPDKINYTLVTGATGVLGRQYCYELSKRGNNLFVSGRSVQKLEELTLSLKSDFPNLKILSFAADLSDEEQRKELYTFADKFKFDMLVNVAGADIQKPFSDYDEDKLTFQTRACFEGAVSVTNFVLKRRAEILKIITISSICGEQPMPYFALYSAVKSALTSFSVALAEELRGTGVTVTAVIAGSIYTRDDVKEYINNLGFWARKAAKSPIYVVKYSLKAAKKGKSKCIPGGLNKCVYFFSKFAPQRLSLRIIARSRKNIKKDVF